MQRTSPRSHTPAETSSQLGHWERGGGRPSLRQGQDTRLPPAEVFPGGRRGPEPQQEHAQSRMWVLKEQQAAAWDCSSGRVHTHGPRAG